MTRPVTSAKVVLVEDRRVTSSEAGSAPLRRYRLARLRLDGRSADPASRFEHLKRVYD
jgi:hypothetical protein